MQSNSSLSSQQVGLSRIRVIVHGASGRMGARLCELISEDGALVLAGAADRADAASIGASSVASRTDVPIVESADGIDVLADVVIDFSVAEAVPSAVSCARRAGASIVVATTGLSREMREMLERESADRGVLIAPNTALGVTAMVRIVSDAAKMLGESFGCTIVEAHHAGKRDSPSGTAIRLQHALESVGTHVKDVHAIRAGDTIGEHIVRFDGPGESLIITHRAVSRDLFARGAMHAARWLAGRGSGLYTMEDVLGFGAR